MSLSDALSIAMSGLRANQAAMSLVSSNVANAETPGYVRKTLNQVATDSGAFGSNVRTVGVNRALDQYIQAQLRTETSGAGYASLRSNFLQQLQSLYGNPGSVGTLEDAFNKLTTAVQALSTSADSQSARIGVVNAANVLASQLNSMTQGIQTLRGAAETGISDSVNTANNLMSQIATINNQLSANPLGGTSTDASTAALLDQRDQYITQLSELMDIRVTANGANQVTVFTTSGVELVGNQAAKLSFNAQGAVTPNTLWNADPSKSNLGSVVISYNNGASIDLTASGGIKSGKIAAYTELRDKSLVEAQNQLDQFAASLSSALSDKTSDELSVSAVRHRSPLILCIQSNKDFLSLSFVSVHIHPPQAVLFLGTDLGTRFGDGHGEQAHRTQSRDRKARQIQRRRQPLFDCFRYRLPANGCFVSHGAADRKRWGLAAPPAFPLLTPARRPPARGARLR